MADISETIGRGRDSLAQTLGAFPSSFCTYGGLLAAIWRSPCLHMSVVWLEGKSPFDPRSELSSHIATCWLSYLFWRAASCLLYTWMMSIVLSVANQKGGCGKTTLAMNIAGALAREGNYRVLLVDSDPQASAMQWRKNAEDSALPFDIQPFPHAVLHKEITKLAALYDLVFIDCPPGGGGGQSSDSDLSRDICRSALRASDVVLVPIRPTPLDYHASHTLLPLIRDVAFVNEKLKVFIAINGKPPGRTKLGEEASGLASELFKVEGVNIRVLKSEVCTRQAFAQSPLVGQVVVDFDPTSKAAEEIRQLTEELVECLVTETRPASVA